MRFSGGTVIAKLLADNGIDPANIIAVVRKEEHAVKMRKLGISVVDTPLDNEAAVEKLVLGNDGVFHSLVLD